jgi:hypothetical protein
MEIAAGGSRRSAVGGGGGGGGPAPFLLKTYEMVDDPSTHAVVSWSDVSDASFVVWNSPEFVARLLPTYFKHSNFSSFIRQLNTYVRNHAFSLFPVLSLNRCRAPCIDWLGCVPANWRLFYGWGVRNLVLKADRKDSEEIDFN